jgi:hypothetical protein
VDREAAPDQQTEPERRQNIFKRLTRSEQIIAALIGLVGVTLAAVLPVILSNKGSGSATPASSTLHSSSPAAASSLPPGQVVQDNTGDLSLLVPENWNSIFTNGWHPRGLPPFANGTDIGPGLNAATNASAWFNDLTTPGVFIGVSRLLITAHYTPNKLLQQITLNGCTYSSNQGYATGEWTGTQEIWSCAHSPTRWLTIAMWPHGHNYILYVQIKIVTPLDQLIGNRALASLSVNF